MRRVLGRANSSNVMKVVWLLDELGLSYEREDRGGAFGGTDTPDYRAMNPNGLIPTLVEDDFTLWESNAVLRYLCNAYAPGHPVWPEDARARGNVDRWMDWQQTTLNRPQSALFQGLVRTPPERRDSAAIKSALHEAGRVWTMLDAVVAQTPFVAGADFTLADIALGVHVHRWFSFSVEKPELSALRAWYDRLLERPAYRTHCAGPVT